MPWDFFTWHQSTFLLVKLHLPMACWEWVFRMQCLFTRGRGSMFTARLLFEEKSLRCCNWNTQIVDWVSPPGVMLQLWYIDFAKGFEGRNPARKNSSRKQGRSRYQSEWYWQRRSLQWWGSYGSFPFSSQGSRALSPSRNLNGKQWALILCTHQEWPTRAQGRREEREL